MSLLTQRLRCCLSLFQIQKRFQQIKAKVITANNTHPIFGNFPNFAEKIALRDSTAQYTYANIFLSAKDLAQDITRKLNSKTNERVLFLCPNDVNYVITLIAIWMSGQIAVPLSHLHPKNVLLYYANDSRAGLLITTPKYTDLMQRVASNTSAKLHVLDEKLHLNAIGKVVQSSTDLETELKFNFSNDALILYTSGTTGSPKGVVLTHSNLHSQITTLTDAWKWTSSDVILHCLPLHHVHGIVNALLCPLYIGAKTVMLPKFNANPVWSYLLGVNAEPNDRKITVFMAVPTIYSKLIDEYEKVFSKDAKMIDYIKSILKNKVRLMVSGSAPLPKPIFDKWLEISGHKLLERYGMTEIGMCLSNPYEMDKREVGFVGTPLVGVSVALLNNEEIVLECTTKQNNEVVFHKKNEYNGELLVKSGSVFKEYFNRREATKKEFLNGWFKTGDVCEYSNEKKMFRMLGRKSVDIIKSGGYKLSAIQIETTIMEHENVQECIVLGIDDKELGQKVVALIIPKIKEQFEIDEFNKWLKEKLPKYSIPKLIKIVDEIPKNIMGKVNKKEMHKIIIGDDKK